LTDLDPLGEAIEAGLGLLAGVSRSDAKEIADQLSTLWSRRLGFAAARLPSQVVITPACGLAGATPKGVRAMLTGCREAARRLSEV
ncbi:MAG: methionine synthase, partial [Actinoplanes sp.]